MVTDDQAENESQAQGTPRPGVVIGRDGNNSNIIVGDHNTINVMRTPEQMRADRNRSAMLEVVRNTWVEGVLEKSLYHETLIDLGLEERPDAVTRPWDVQVQMPDRPNRVLLLGTPIMQVFDEAQGELLILGAPGAGKTTMLLELARDTIIRAQKDAALPIPVVFNLSSWTDPKQPLAAWLVDELINKYRRSKKVAQSWVENGELLLLLDGLDEVRVENREACVQAINSLTMPLVVCSRIVDYEALSTRLKLCGAVLLQPLTDEQIDSYFEHVGPDLASVRHAWRQDTELQELARQPLMLSIMTLAYRGATPKALAGEQAGSLDVRRKRLFDTYIRQMFVRVGRAKDLRYTSQQTTHYLSWLAQKLLEQGQTVFLLENMRRSWLPSAQRDLPGILTVLRTLMVLIIGLVFGLIGLMSGLDAETMGWPQTVVSSVLWFVLINGFVVGLGGALMGGADGVQKLGPVVRQLFGWGKLVEENPVEALKWSWMGALMGLIVLTLVTILGFVVGQMVGLMIGLVVGLLVGLVVGLANGLESIELKAKMFPNQGIRESLKNMLMVTLIIALIFGLIWGMILGPIFGPIPGLMFGPMFGLIFGMACGGNAALNHYLLRFLLQRSGHIPRHYEHFLDYAVERLFLRRVGGSYVFVHRLLMEHFAAMWGKI